MPKEHEFVVPPEAFDPKNWFTTRAEADAALPEIRAWIKEGNEPHMWRGHTHSPPPPSATPEYIAEFGLSAARIKAKLWAACPCCSPLDRKFGKKEGKIAWFPEEHVIRLVGPDCFKALNKEGHERAEEKFREEQRVWRDKVFLLGNLDKVGKMVEVLKDARAAAEALEQLQTDLVKPLSLYAPDLWHHIRTGAVHLHLTELQPFRTKDGGVTTRPVEVERRYGQVAVSFFDPEARKLSRSFTAVLEALEEIEFVDPLQTLREMGESQREKVARILAKGSERGRELLALLQERRACLSDSNLGTLRAWGRHEKAPIRFYVRRDGRELIVGSRPTHAYRIRLPYFIDRHVSELPALTGTESAPARSKAFSRG